MDEDHDLADDAEHDYSKWSSLKVGGCVGSPWAREVMNMPLNNSCTQRFTSFLSRHFF